MLRLRAAETPENILHRARNCAQKRVSKSYLFQIYGVQADTQLIMQRNANVPNAT